MKGRFFDKGTFKEAFVQLKVAGILFSVLGALTSILFTVGMIVDRIHYSQISDAMGYGSDMGEEIFPIAFFYILYTVAFVVVPILVLTVFSFLTKRNACDFYHSVPVKRKTIYISMLAAVMTWIAIIYACTCAFAMVITGFDSGMTIDMLGAGKIILETFVACILLVGVFCLGTALTGTGVTNFVVSLMILTGPRIIVMLVLAIFEELIPYSEMGYGSFLLNNGYNIIFRIGADLESRASVPLVPALIYSTVLGVIYVCFGCFAFTKRKSETAAQATAHPAIQTVCKMVPSFMCALIAILGILEVILDGEDDPTTFFAIVVLLIISVAVYLIYDVITNRKARSFVKSIKQLPIFFGVVAIAGVIIGVISYYERQWEPSVDDIENVELFTVDYIYTYLGIDKIDIENDEINKIIVDAYNRQIKEHYEGNANFVYYDYDCAYEHEQIVVGIDTGLITRYKRINITSKEYDAIIDICTEVVKEKGYGIKFPRYKEYYTDIYAANINVSGKYQRELYECLKKEVEGKGISEIIDGDYSEIVDTVSVYIHSDYESTRRIAIPVGDNLPNTKKLLMEIAYESAQYYKKMAEVEGDISDYQAFEEWVGEYNNKEMANREVDIHYIVTNADVETTRYLYVEDEFTEKEYKEFYGMLQKIIEESKTASENGVVLYMVANVPDRFFYEDDGTIISEESDYVTTGVEVAYKVSEETVKEFMSFIGTLDYMTVDEGLIEYEYYD